MTDRAPTGVHVKDEMTPHHRHPGALRVPPRAEAQSGVSALWREHRRWIAAVLLAHKPREAELEDLLQEVAVRVVAHADELRDPGAIKSWLRSVALNVARSAGRRQRVRRDARDTIEQHARTEDHDAPRVERQEILDAALALPEAYREPLLLRSLRGLSYKQIADTLGVPVTTIETRLVRARRMLKDAIERAHDPVPSTHPADTETQDPS